MAAATASESIRRTFGSRADWLICLALAVVVLALYWPTIGFEYSRYDDDDYVTENAMVKAGMTWDGIVWAFTTGHAANWHPVTWLSLMLDVELFGVSSGAQHAVNMLLHALNSILCFGVLRRMTGAVWPSAFVAGLFAVHPQHVESVAWVAERKDVLSTAFWLLTMAAYARYADRPTRGRYLTMLAPFTLGLMAKPMLVTLPFVLLLFDYWPLRRMDDPAARRRAILEKVPMLVIVVVSAAITFVVQQAGGAVGGEDTHTLGIRIANALVVYGIYVVDMVAPHGLCALYPFPQEYPAAWRMILSAVFVVAMSVFAIRWLRTRPWLAVGWAWYLGTLVPVIGIVKVGSQSMADRYTYVPGIGFKIVLAWAGAELLKRLGVPNKAVAGIALAVLAAFFVLTTRQIPHWRDPKAIFERCLAVTTDNHVMHANLGVVLRAEGRHDEARHHFEEAVRIRPNYAMALTNLANELAKSGDRDDQAVELYERALRSEPDNYSAHASLGALHARAERFADATRHYESALRIDPRKWTVHYQYGIILAQQGKREAALTRLREAVRLAPDIVKPRFALANLLAQLERFAEAVAEFEALLAIEPDHAIAKRNLQRCRQELRKR